MDQSDDDVTLYCRNAGNRWEVVADYVVLTVPFPVLRHVEVLTPFSRHKQRAIRQLHYDASAKVFLQFRRRFWEEDDGIIGGGTVTDLAVRNLYYPDHGRDTGRGVMLASYTWGEDAQRWGSLSPDDRIVQALEDVTRIHPQALDEFEVGASKMWHDDEFAGGAFALFDPGQQTLLYESIIAPEGRIHFAGEHASLAHAWIQGAIESGLRAAAEVHQTDGDARAGSPSTSRQASTQSLTRETTWRRLGVSTMLTVVPRGGSSRRRRDDTPSPRRRRRGRPRTTALLRWCGASRRRRPR